VFDVNMMNLMLENSIWRTQCSPPYSN